MSLASEKLRIVCAASLCALALMLGAVTPALGQAASRILLPGGALSDTMTAEKPAATFAFDAGANSLASLFLNTARGAALSMLVSDINGELLAQASASGEPAAAALDNVPLVAGGRYFVFVSYAPGAPAQDTSFDISLRLETSIAAAPAEASTEELPDLVMLVGGIEVELSWLGAADLNLEVRDPSGQNLHWNSRATDNGGSFGFDANGLCQVLEDSPAETASWQPGFLPTGSYEIIVYYEGACDGLTGSVAFAVDVTVNGQPSGRIENTLTPVGQTGQNVYVARFEVGADGGATVSAGGAYPASSLTELPDGFQPGASAATPILQELPIVNTISNAQPFHAYTFSANADDIISVEMQTTADNLDTLLQILDPAGNIVYFNDDAGDGSTNSSISNARLYSSGTYTLIATRYGKELGGTEGQFQLSLTGSTNGAALQLGDLPQGDIEVLLYWSTSADLQLVVRDPSGESIYDDNPVSVSGGILQSVGNANCVPATSAVPLSYVYFPSGSLRPGTYEVDVWYQNTCADFPLPVDFTLLIEVGGQQVMQTRQFPQPGQHYVTSFTVQPGGSALAGEAGYLDAGSGTLDYTDALAGAPPITSGLPVNGIISGANTFDIYSFQGNAGETVTIQMTAATPTLDTNVYLISPSGQEIAANDDGNPLDLAAEARKTDSVINSVILPSSGAYAIIATRYGNQYGGTLGVYELMLQQN